MRDGSTRVYLGDISESNLREEITRGLDFIGYREIIGPESVVFVKPNLTKIVHEPGITTTPMMARAVLEVLSPLVKKIYVGESDGGNFSYSADDSLRNHGLCDVARALPNVEVVNLTRLPWTRVTETVCGRKVWVDLPELVLEKTDCLISLPVLKTHAMTNGTYSLKNLWGCYPDPRRTLYHKDLDYKLALINKALRNRIQIVDGYWALDGHGPIEGTPRLTKKILVGNDPVAADRTAALMMGLDVKTIGHIGVAARYGLGQMDVGQIAYNRDMNGEKLPTFKPYKIKMDYLSALLFKSPLLARVVLDSPISPAIYTLINLTRPEERRTYWIQYNKRKLN
jgi:uncharacterized protein (DUF362 family)